MVKNFLNIKYIFNIFYSIATILCLNERAIYSHDVLAVVIQQLVDINPIPVLFMRTILQALSFVPKMVGFVMNILQRLITKQVS
jgi:symplekin